MLTAQGLDPNTTYYLRAGAVYTGMKSYGDEPRRDLGRGEPVVPQAHERCHGLGRPARGRGEVT
ncbi:MAG: hypothetical protein IIA73_11725 [Proteobacteria bacterium]|nr:hypothetical protein [Pseudomonadota bacterium]